jgi:hypothetical protein
MSTYSIIVNNNIRFNRTDLSIGIRCTRFPSVTRKAMRLLMGTRTSIATRNPSWWARPRWPCTRGRPS